MRYKILRFVLTVLLALAGYFLQTGVFTSALYFGSIPNILLVVTVLHGFLRGPRTGIWMGLLCGLLWDLQAGELLGFYALFYLYAGAFGGLFNRFFYLDELALPILLCGLCDFLYGCFMFFFQCVLYNQTDFSPYLTQIILPEVVYTMLVTIVFFRLLLFVHERCDEAEKRSARRFV